MVGEAAGWYARLDQACPDRAKQIECWLDFWESSVISGTPIAASLPPTWPTLTAGLLTDPGVVLEKLLSRFEAVEDGRSPKGAYSTPARLVGSVLADELASGGHSKKKESPPILSLSAIPPAFRDYAQRLNNEASSSLGEDDYSDSSEKTSSGIPLPFADPSCGAGLVVSQLIRLHAQRIELLSDEKRCSDTLRLLEGLQLVGFSRLAVEAARRRILITLGKAGLVDLSGDSRSQMIGRAEAEMILESNVLEGDPLLSEWPWNERPKLLISRPPWIRIKDRFRGHEEGGRLRRDLSSKLREAREYDGSLRFSALRGNVNMYRLFLERSVQLVGEEGRIRIIVPDSILRERSSAPLRKLLVENNEWFSTWSFPDPNRVFPGISHGVAVLGLTVGGKTEKMVSYGPLSANDISPEVGLSRPSPSLDLERGSWSSWTDATWAVPRMPIDSFDRKKVIEAIGRLADKPRLSEEGSWLNPDGNSVRVRVGEIDQSAWSEYIEDWSEGNSEIPFIRNTHFVVIDGKVCLHHPAFDNDVVEGAIQRSNSSWNGDSNSPSGPRIACQAILGSTNNRRLRWAVIPEGCVLSNSVNYLEFSEDIIGSLTGKGGGSLVVGLEWLCKVLNSEDLEIWSRAWGANNNVSYYEIESLPFPVPEDELSFSM
tara:strand:+ start:54020 stop:55987 length:1968 start_codon:yes stop_codon:yes gene_type:complete